MADHIAIRSRIWWNHIFLLSFLVATFFSAQALPTSNTSIHVVVSVPFDPPYIFRKDAIKPAIELAVATVSRNMPPALRNYDFIVTYRNSTCSLRSALQVVDYYYDHCVKDEKAKRCNMQSPLLLLGPVCSDASSVVAIFAEQWNVPIISTGSHAIWVAPGPEYPTLTRITPSYADLGYFIYHLFRRLKYGYVYPVYLIYEDVFHEKTTESECYYLMQAIRVIFTGENLPIDVSYHAISDLDFNSDTFVKSLENPKVALMCASSDSVRKIMLSAWSLGCAVEKKNDWFVIDLHNDKHYAHGAWKRGDDLDPIAKTAYRSLKVFSLRVSSTDKFLNFTRNVQNDYRKNGVKADVNAYVEGFYDAIILYVHALNKTVSQGFDVLDGKIISRNMRNLTFSGIAGPVTLDEFGDRNGYYSLLAMKDAINGKYEKFLEYVGNPRRITVYKRSGANMDPQPNTVLLQNWADNGLRWTPISGQGKGGRGRTALNAVFGAMAGIVICFLLIAAPFFYRSKCSSQTNNNHLTYDNHEAMPIPLREEGSVTTCMTALDDDIKT